MRERIQKEHAARAARNQSVFREVNESVKEVNESFGRPVPQESWICECADPACVEHIALTSDEYENLRAKPTRFAVAPGNSHVFFEVEDVVKQTERYWVVEKIGAAGLLAACFDPRARGEDGGVDR